MQVQNLSPEAFQDRYYRTTDSTGLHKLHSPESNFAVFKTIVWQVLDDLIVFLQLPKFNGYHSNSIKILFTYFYD